MWFVLQQLQSEGAAAVAINTSLNLLQLGAVRVPVNVACPLVGCGNNSR